MHNKYRSYKNIYRVYSDGEFSRAYPFHHIKLKETPQHAIRRKRKPKKSSRRI